jgi:hypothetical protein
VYTGDPRRDAMRYQILLDQLELYRQHDASGALWTYAVSAAHTPGHLPPT